MKPMNKAILLLCAALALFACRKEPPAMVEETPAVPVTFDLAVTLEESSTKALKDNWEAGDVVYVFFRDIPGKYIKKIFNGTFWTDTYPRGEFVHSDFVGIGMHPKMNAIHFPNYEVTVSYDSKENLYRFEDSSGKPVYSYYMLCKGAVYYVSGTTVSGSLNMGKPDGFVQFFVPDIPEADVPLYRLREANGHLRPRACESVDQYGNFYVVDRPDGYCLKGFAYKGGVLFAGYLASAGTATDYSFQLVKNVSAAKACAQGTYVLKANKAIPAGVVVRLPALSSWACGKWVDMGLAGKWATGNLSDDGGTTIGEANIVAPDAAGKYYAWGETVGAVSSALYFSRWFDWPYYPMANGSRYELTKYCYDASYGSGDFTDNLTNLESADDAAAVNLGSAWRMPSKAECQALANTTRFEWQWQDRAYAINGQLVTCKDTGLSLFLPAAGRGSRDELLSFHEGGYYWTTTLDTNPTVASSLSIDNTYVGSGSREEGRTIRPVFSTDLNPIHSGFDPDEIVF